MLWGERNVVQTRSARRSHSWVTADRAPEVNQIDDLFGLATAQYRNRNFSMARNLCRKILERDPQHVRSLVLLGDLAQQEGRNNQAIKFLNQALALDPRNAAAHDNLAIAYQALGRRDEAVLHFCKQSHWGCLTWSCSLNTAQQLQYR
jgi:Tfp pilus assembly protein PilF